MLKYALLATCVAITSPAFAQDIPATPPAPEQQMQAAEPMKAEPAAQEAPAQPMAQEAVKAEPATEESAMQATPAADPAAPQPAEASAMQTAPTQPAQPATEQAATDQDAAVQTAETPVEPAAQPAASQAQVAAVVTKEFPTYDADSSGDLNKTEFAAWMGKLRAASEPTYQPESAQAVAWNDQAFAQADIDKSATLTQAELTTFLTPKTGS